MSENNKSPSMMDKIKSFEYKKHLLTLAELIDAFRIVPRLFLIMYGILVYNLYTWFISLETIVQEKCDAALIKILIDSGESLEAAKLLACQVNDVVGGPTSPQAAFVTAIIGLASAAFGFYLNTGRKWSEKQKESVPIK